MIKRGSTGALVVGSNPAVYLWIVLVFEKNMYYTSAQGERKYCEETRSLVSSNTYNKIIILHCKIRNLSLALKWLLQQNSIKTQRLRIAFKSVAQSHYL